MKTVLVVWELGSGLGHVMRAAAYARALHDVGLRIVVAMPDLADAARLTWPDGTLILPAPQPRRVPDNFANQSTYAELLYGCGYHDVNQVSGLVTGWFNLMDLCAADLVLADHAPSAHIAAAVRGIPVVRIGSGFFAPPARGATPRFRDWHDTDAARARAIEAHILAVANSVRLACGLPEAREVAEAFLPDRDLIASPAELDCYAALRPADSVSYVGYEAIEGQGRRVAWPGEGVRRRRIVAYIKRDYSSHRQVLDALRPNFRVVAFVAGLSESERAQLQDSDTILSPEPLALGELAAEADALVCHGGAGTAPIFLAAGKPVLLLPVSAEQRCNAVCIATTGAGRWLAETEIDESLDAVLRDLTENPAPTAAALDLAQRWRSHPGALASVTRHALELCADN